MTAATVSTAASVAVLWAALVPGAVVPGAVLPGAVVSVAVVVSDAVVPDVAVPDVAVPDVAVLDVVVLDVAEAACQGMTAAPMHVESATQPPQQDRTEAPRAWPRTTGRPLTSRARALRHSMVAGWHSPTEPIRDGYP